jgi:hypothetical protein
MLSYHGRYYCSLVTTLTCLVLQERCPRILSQFRSVSPPDSLGVVNTTFISRYQEGFGVWFRRWRLRHGLRLRILLRRCVLRFFRGQRYFIRRRVWTANFRISSIKSTLSFSQFCNCLGLKRSLLQQGEQLSTFLYRHTSDPTPASNVSSVVWILCWQSMLTHLEPHSQSCSATSICFTFELEKFCCWA